MNHQSDVLFLREPVEQMQVQTALINGWRESMGGVSTKQLPVHIKTVCVISKPHHSDGCYLSFVDYPDQMTSSQSQLAGPEGKAEPSRENSFVDFSKVIPVCRTVCPHTYCCLCQDLHIPITHLLTVTLTSPTNLTNPNLNPVLTPSLNPQIMRLWGPTRMPSLSMGILLFRTVQV